MKQSEIQEKMGREVQVKHGKMTFLARIVDYKCSYGRDRFLVEPLSGVGKDWIELWSIYRKNVPRVAWSYRVQMYTRLLDIVMMIVGHGREIMATCQKEKS